MATIQVVETCDNRKQMYQRVHALQAAGRKGVRRHIDYKRTEDTNQPYRVYWLEYPATVPDSDDAVPTQAMVSEGGPTVAVPAETVEAAQEVVVALDKAIDSLDKVIGDTDHSLVDDPPGSNEQL